jgi:hypothetical protein
MNYRVPENPQPVQQVVIHRPSERLAGAAVLGVVLALVIVIAIGGGVRVC